MQKMKEVTSTKFLDPNREATTKLLQNKGNYQ